MSPGRLGVAALLVAAVGRLALGAVTDDLDALRGRLRSDDPGERRAAVAGLARLDREEAWLAVVEVLADPDAQVADEAQLRLAACRLPAVVEVLHGKRGLLARQALVAVRTAELLGRIDAPVDGAALARALKAKDPELRRMVLWTVERQAPEGHLLLAKRRAFDTALARALGRDADREVRAAALMALAALDPEGASLEALAALAGERPKQSALRSAATLVAGRLPAEPGPSLLLVAANDDHPSVRAQAVEVLARRGDRTSALVLVDRLGKEERARLAWRLVAHLRSLSGLEHGRDVRPWRDWVAALPDDWTADLEERAVGHAEGDERTSAFVGLPLLSDRVALLFDFSGSLWMERESGGTRKAVLDVEVRRALEGLPEECRFNLIPYTGEPLAWKDELVAATPRNVAAALGFFEGCRAQGKGNVWDALLLALADPEVDTIVLFTDGRPTGGAHWNLELLRDLIAERNRFRRVAIDAVVVDASKRIREYWERICADSGGRCLTVEME